VKNNRTGRLDRHLDLSRESAWLLRATAIYFDQLVMRDSVDAGVIQYGPDPLLDHTDDIKALKSANMLEVLAPQNVIKDYGEPLAEAIESDISDAEFKAICDKYDPNGKGIWRIWTAKIPNTPKMDETVQKFAMDNADRAQREGVSERLSEEAKKEKNPYDENPLFAGGPYYRDVRVPLHVAFLSLFLLAPAFRSNRS
jgi:hypothetical protein